MLVEITELESLRSEQPKNLPHDIINNCRLNVVREKLIKFRFEKFIACSRLNKSTTVWDSTEL